LQAAVRHSNNDILPKVLRYLPKFNSTSLQALLVEESIQKKRKGRKCLFFGTTFKKNESGGDFQRVQIWNDCSQKQKKNYGSHPLKSKKYFGVGIIFSVRTTSRSSYVGALSRVDIVFASALPPPSKKQKNSHGSHTETMGAVGHCLYRRLWPSGAGSKLWRVLVGSWVMPPSTGSIEIERGG